MRLRLSSGIVGALLLSAFCTFGFTANAVEQGGVLTGTIRYDGAPPKPVQLDVSKDRDVCGVRPLYDQSLLVGADGGIANVVVTIPGVTGGAPLKPETDVRFDQKDCEYTPHVAVFPASRSPPMPASFSK